MPRFFFRDEELYKIGRRLKKWRIKHGITMRKFCVGYNFDAHTLSKIERGIIWGDVDHMTRELNRKLDDGD